MRDLETDYLSKGDNLLFYLNLIINIFRRFAREKVFVWKDMLFLYFSLPTASGKETL